MTAPTKPRISLFHLPPEVREFIYQYVLILDEPIHFRLDRPPVVEPGLLAVCHLIRNEALPIFYGNNTFYASMNEVTRVALHNISESKLPLFKSIQAFSTYGSCFSAPSSWSKYIRCRMKSLCSEYGRGLVRKDAWLIPMKGRDQILWTTIAQIDDFKIRDDGVCEYFFKADPGGDDPQPRE